MRPRRRRNLPPGPAQTAYDPNGHVVKVAREQYGEIQEVFVTWDEWQLAAQVRMDMISPPEAIRRGRPLTHQEILRRTAHQQAPKNVSEWFRI